MLVKFKTGIAADKGSSTSLACACMIHTFGNGLPLNYFTESIPDKQP